VLVLDRAGFPSDTISSHQVQVPGIALLHRWGLLDRLIAAGTPVTRRVRFDPGPVAVQGCFPACEGVDALLSPRRTVLDSLLIAAAREAGAEIRENVRVEDLLRDGSGRIVGCRAREHRGPEVTETATLVVGADGKHSSVARAVGAREYRTRPVKSFACYGYWSGLPEGPGQLIQRPGIAVAAFPTNDDLTMVYLAAPLSTFDSFRADIEGSYLAALDRCGDLGERLRAATRAERLRTTPDQPNTFRQSHGPGWALAGDAGVVMDSITAQGIANALCDADRLAAAIVTGLGDDGDNLDRALARRHRERDARLRAMFDFTVGLADYQPAGLRQRVLLESIARRPAEVSRFLGAFAGITPVDDYLAPTNAIRVLGARGLARLAWGGIRAAIRRG
jgi:2-polyprenyl-6-methoxyphenol hydroxylase-like FAD-dependent oxidoreductase